jgi:hypothetical protein
VRCFPVLQNLRELTILQENDATSRRDVNTCARRYLEVRRPVNIVEPKIGNDFNDFAGRRADERALRPASFEAQRHRHRG